MSTPVDMVQTYDDFAQKAAACDNLGASHDDRDLYRVFADLQQFMAEQLPPFACRAGCHECCSQSPLVSSVEWQALYPHLLAMPAETLQRVIAMAELLKVTAASLRQSRRGKLDQAQAEHFRSPQLQCPLLIDGACAAYEGRPFMCRAFGYTMKPTKLGIGFLGSDLAAAYLMATFPKGVNLPAFPPYADKVEQLNKAQGGTLAYMPQWLWAHIRDGAFIPEANLQPDFETLPQRGG